jgi:hypothetical protein
MRIISLFIIFSGLALSQDILGGQIHGYFEANGQYYREDSTINAPDVPESFLNNNFLNMIYTNDNVELGFRVESYQNPLLGFERRWEGEGIMYRYVTYRSDLIDVTAGNFYEQFGTGMIMRSYEERNLGIDNTIDGIRFKFRPTQGVELTGLYGRARDYWELSDGIVRGVDLNVSLNDLFLSENSNNEFFYNNLFSIGGSVVSRYQEDNSSLYNFPENVLAYSTRFSAIGNFYSLDAEYMFKYNDPLIANEYNFATGQGIKLLGALYGDGMSINFNYHYIDNLDSRVDRDRTLLELPLNFIPPLTRQQTLLLATVFPYGTQPVGETGIGIDGAYKFKRGSKLGGKYGTQLGFNFSTVSDLDRTVVLDEERGLPVDYNSNFLSPGDSIYYRELNIDFSKRITKNFKLGLYYINAQYNRDVNEQKSGYGYVFTNIAIAEGTYKFWDDWALRVELQHLWYEDEGRFEKKLEEQPDLIDNQNGDWVAATVELTIAPHYYFTYVHQYNYGNADEDLRVHYPTANITYVYDATRFMIGYSRIRAGLLCVGGICRLVPSSNGYNFTISTSF